MLARAYVRWRSIMRTDRPDVCVRRMVVNANTSWWRRRSSGEVPAGAQVGWQQTDPADVGRDTADRDAMWRLICQLPYRQRAVIVLRYYEDLDDATIAEILDCSPVTVRTHAMRALATLRTRHSAQPLSEQKG